MSQQRLLELDAIRGIAALAVVFYHLVFRYDQIYGHTNIAVDWAYYGHSGVELFFMVSGFVIFWSLVRIRRPLDFLVSRFSRLYPAFWAAVLISFSAVYFLGLPGRETPIDHALANLLMFHEYLGASHVDGVYWTLTVELTFYFWIFLFYLRSSLDKIEPFFLSIIFISVLHSLQLITVPALIYKVLIMQYLPLFLAGICFYKLSHQQGKPYLLLTSLGLSLLSTIFIFSVAEALLFSGFYLLFYLAVSGRLSVLRVKPLVFLGGISYSLYLVHQNLGYIILNKSYQLDWPPLIGLILSLSICIGLATLIMRYIEKPSLIYIRQYYKNSAQIQKLAHKLDFKPKQSA